MNQKIAIAIPSYQNRYNSKDFHLLYNVQNFDKEFDVYVFLSEDDNKLQEYYNSIEENDHVHLIVTNCKTIFEKRQYMLDYLSNKGYNGYFQFDDDVRYAAYKIDETTKRTTSDTYRFYPCDMNEMLHKMLNTAQKYDAGYVSVIRWGYIAWQQPGKVSLNRTVNPAQIGYFSIDKINQYNLKYDTSGYINEDLDLVIQMFQNKINTCTVCDYMFQTLNITYKEQEKSTVSTNIGNTVTLYLHEFIKYHLRLVVDKNGVIRARINMPKYWGTKELPDISDSYSQGLLKLCEAEDVEGVKRYILEHKNKKN